MICECPPTLTRLPFDEQYCSPSDFNGLGERKELSYADL